MARSPAPPERVLAYADAAHPPTLRDIVYAYYSRVQLYILLLLLVASSSISCKNTAYASTIYRASTHPHPAGPRQGEEEEATVSPQSESEKRPPPPACRDIASLGERYRRPQKDRNHQFLGLSALRLRHLFVLLGKIHVGSGTEIAYWEYRSIEYPSGET